MAEALHQDELSPSSVHLSETSRSTRDTWSIGVEGGERGGGGFGIKALTGKVIRTWRWHAICLSGS